MKTELSERPFINVPLVATVDYWNKQLHKPFYLNLAAYNNAHYNACKDSDTKPASEAFTIPCMPCRDRACSSVEPYTSPGSGTGTEPSVLSFYESGGVSGNSWCTDHTASGSYVLWRS